jgi:hypothetical protein
MKLYQKLSENIFRSLLENLAQDPQQDLISMKLKIGSILSWDSCLMRVCVRDHLLYYIRDGKIGGTRDVTSLPGN